MNTSSKYSQIAKTIMNDIDSGLLHINNKLPSLRSLMSLHSISMTTALACYRYLENCGYARSEEKKGYYVQKPFEVKTFNFPQFKSEVSTISSFEEEHNVPINEDTFATAKLDTELFDETYLNKSMAFAAKRSLTTLNYEHPQGNEELRNQLANHFNQQGFHSNKDELVITNGCLDAVVIALEIVSKPDDIIIVSSPCYSGLLDILALLKRQVIEIPSTKDGIDLHQLISISEQKNIAACIFTANHQNPTGHSLSNTQKEALCQYAAHYKIPIIEDDVFRELTHQHSVPLPIKYYDKEGWVLWCSSFSKSLAPGLRIGWCKAGRFLKQYTKHRKIKTLGVNQPIQVALADYISKGHYMRHLKKVNSTLSFHTRTYIDFLTQNLPDNAEIYFPNGGLVLWVHLPKINAAVLAANLQKESVYIQAGNIFSTTLFYQHYFRLNIGLIPNDEAINQLKTLCLHVKNMNKDHE